MVDKAEAGGKFARLLEIQEQLRAPGGCPWDRRQKQEDIRRYLLDEAYELVDAIDEGSPAGIREELGDLLYQILFLAAIAEEEDLFDINGVLAEITEKMLHRHPHVFADLKIASVEEVKANWKRIKNERKGTSGRPFFFERIPRSMPALARAQEVTRRAATVGFDWSDHRGIIRKIEEEMAELSAAANLDDLEKIAKEAGDVIFSAMNLCRFLGLEAEKILHDTTDRFVRRFTYIEDRLKMAGKPLAAATLAEMDALWEEAKDLQEKGELEDGQPTEG